MKKIRLIFAALFAFYTASCNTLPEADFYEVEGTISLNLYSALPLEGWTSSDTAFFPHIVSVSLDDRKGDVSQSIYIQTPGSYQFWLLGARLLDTAGTNPIVQITDQDGIILTRSSIEIPQHERLRWLTHTTEGFPIQVDIDNAGLYQITIESGGERGLKIGKLHLSLNNENPPQGTGFTSTSNPRLNPLDEKSEHYIEIPPAAAFGLLSGGSSDQLESLTAAGIPISYWWDQSEEYEYVDSVHTLHIADFAQNLSDLSDLFEFSKDSENSRGFHLANSVELHNSDIKRYPALWYKDKNLTGFDQLQRQVTYLSDPTELLYEIPYFATVPEWFLNSESSPRSDELLARWIQFSAFSTLMTFPMPAEPLSRPVLDQLKRYTTIRTELFPYIYSYTLRSRTERVKHVNGEMNYPNQYLFGNEFLVAPVVEEGAEDRFVRFPDGLWYSYWTDESFDGGQTWSVNTPMNDIPVFVRAGSIIPKWDKVSENDEMDIVVYTGSSGTFRLYQDDGETTNYRNGEFSTTAFRYFEQPDYATFTIGARVRGFEGQSDEVSYQLRFKFMETPSDITVNGNSVDRWLFDEENDELVIPWSQSANERAEFHFVF